MVRTRKFVVLALVTLLISLSLSACVSSDWDFGSPFRFFFGFPFAIFSIALYFLPTIIAAIRHAKSILGVVLLNIFLGWTFIGW
jgi:urea transporter